MRGGGGGGGGEREAAAADVQGRHSETNTLSTYGCGFETGPPPPPPPLAPARAAATRGDTAHIFSSCHRRAVHRAPPSKPPIGSSR